LIHFYKRFFVKKFKMSRHTYVRNMNVDEI